MVFDVDFWHGGSSWVTALDDKMQSTDWKVTAMLENQLRHHGGESDMNSKL